MVQPWFSDLNSSELKKYIFEHEEDDYILLDVRQPKEYAKGHIPGAILIPLGELETRVIELDQGKDIIIYCRSGKRSRIAAFFITASGISFKAVYNLERGIAGWYGAKLEELPAVALFDDIEDVETILLKAMDLEKGAENFYSLCADKYSGSVVASFASTLAKLEEGHARVVYSILKCKKPDVPSFTELYSNMSGDILEGGVKIEDALSRISTIADEICINFMEMALDIEYRAYDLYRNLAMSADKPDMKDAFYQLSSQEKSHIRIVAGGIALCFEKS
jgi:rhodanese-related sulfurtransferase/rubrerythrin